MNTKKILFALILTVFSIQTFGQTPNWAWAKSGGGTKYDWSAGIATDASGNIVVTGVFDSASITFGGTTLSNAGRRNIYVVKYDPNGNVLWAKSAGGTSVDDANGIATDSSGNIIVTGSFQSGTITFGGTTLTKVNGMDIFVVKYDPNGNVLWAKSAGGIQTDVAWCVTTDSNNNIVVGGWFGSASITFGGTTLTNMGGIAPGQNIFVVKYDPNGNVLWAKSAGGKKDELAKGIATDASGNVFVTGFFISDTITFGGTTLTSSGNLDMYIVKYDSNGNVLWAKSAGGSSQDNANGITADASGNIIVTGGYDSPTIKFGGTTLTNFGGRDMYMVKYDPNGNVLWAKSAGGTNYQEEGTDIATDATGNIVVTGTFDSPTIIFGGTTLTNLGGTDIYVVKYDPNGNVLWAKSAGGTNYDWSAGIAADAIGNIVVTGTFDSPTIIFGGTTLTNLGVNDIFISKISPTTSIGHDVVKKEMKMIVAPNPFNNSTLITLSEPVQNADIIITNQLGKKISEKKFSGKEYTLEQGVMTPGIYFIQIIDIQHQFHTTKFIVE